VQKVYTFLSLERAGSRPLAARCKQDERGRFLGL
jgi:hypothetical protein